jgi:uncharacterized protein YjiS (DUF1127 family)
MNWAMHEHLKSDHISRPWLTLHFIEEVAEFAIAGSPRFWLLYVVRLLREWHERSRQRSDLRMLDDRLLQDVGLTRADVESEARKWFWMK